MSLDDRRRKAAAIRELMRTEGSAIGENTRSFNEGRYDAVAGIETYENLKDEARAIKEVAIERLPELVEEVVDAVEENGGTVYLADDASDARDYIADVVGEADRLVKSKSMTSEEVEINEYLEERGVEVVETDLGEWVLQVADEAPSHIVAPAIHKSRADIASLFNERFEQDSPLETAEELTAFASERLGELIADADVGMTGANFITADSGTLALVTSEGNARKTVVSPPTHIAVAGVEKIVPTVEDLQPFVELIGRSATGQDITSYVSLLTPPVESPLMSHEESTIPVAETSTDRDFHLVLLDNGRLEMREDDELRETLYCIRCSACANSCANFQEVGGHAFGGETYSGGIATGWEAGIEGLDTAAEFNDLCTGCSRCVNQCPVGIDIPWINTVVRNRINRATETSRFDFLVEGLMPDEEPGGIDLQKRLFGNFDTLANIGTAFTPVSNWLLRRRLTKLLLQRLAGVDARRNLPTFNSETLTAWFAGRPGEGPADPDREVVLYPDPYTEYVMVERGKATVRVLEALGVSVQVPDIGATGRAPLSQGMVETARARADALVSGLLPQLETGPDVVVIEPSDLAMFRDDYRRLLDPDDVKPLAERSFELFEYLYDLVEADPARLDVLPLDGATLPDAVAYHSHCQQRTLGLEPYTVAVLRELGVDVATTDVECCGMAGSFGYKREYYELSMAVGETLVENLAAKDLTDRPLVASGTSCLEQLGDLFEAHPRHPIELLVPGRPG